MGGVPRSLRFAFQSQTKLYLISDFYNGGELFYYLSNGRFSENRARFYAAEIALGLQYLHSKGIVYRDLKPENLLLDADGHIKITDFGLSKENASGEELHSLCGTPEYLAPEIILKKVGSWGQREWQAYGMAVDWWSLGTLIYEMISGLPPFYDKNRRVMYNKILSAPLSRCPYMSAEISLSLGVGALTPRVRPVLAPADAGPRAATGLRVLRGRDEAPVVPRHRLGEAVQEGGGAAVQAGGERRGGRAERGQRVLGGAARHHPHV